MSQRSHALLAQLNEQAGAATVPPVSECKEATSSDPTPPGGERSEPLEQQPLGVRLREDHRGGQAAAARGLHRAHILRFA